MINPGAILSVFRFEWNRTMTAPRMAWWVALTAFPAAIAALVTYLGAPLESHHWTVLLFILVPGVVCLMGLLLWSTPVLQSELEGKTWTYLAVRPGGKAALLLGKYLTAVSWTVLAGWLGLVLALIIATPDGALAMGSVLAALVVLSSLAYGAVFTFIGVVIFKRAMVVAVVYSLMIELLVGFVPAVVNELTVQFRLRALLVKWMGWDDVATAPRLITEVPDVFKAVFGSAPAWQQLLIVLGLAVVLLSVSLVVLRARELALSEEG